MAARTPKRQFSLRSFCSPALSLRCGCTLLGVFAAMLALCLPTSAQDAPREPTPEVKKLLVEGRQAELSFRWEEAAQKYQAALKMARDIRDRIGEAGALNNIGEILSSLGYPQQSLQYYLKALETIVSIGDSRVEAITLSNLGLLYAGMGQIQNARECYDRALPLHKAAKDVRGEGLTFMNIGLLYYNIGQPQQALDFYKDAQARIHPDDKRAMGVLLSNYGLAYSSIGQLQTALDYLERSLSIERQIEAKRDEANTLTNLGLTYFSLGQPSRALSYFKEALTLHQEFLNKPGEAVTCTNIGNVYANVGQERQAIPFFERALPLQDETQDTAGKAVTLLSIGNLYLQIGDGPKALVCYEQALTLQKTNQDLRSEAATYNNIANVFIVTAQLQKAAAPLQQALALTKSTRDTRGQAIVLNNLGFVYTRTHQLQKALAAYAEALPLYESVRDEISDPTQIGTYQEMMQYDFYARYAMLLLLLKRPEEAFMMVERGRGQGLARLAAQNRLNLGALLGKSASSWQQANTAVQAQQKRIYETEQKSRNAITPETQKLSASQLAAARSDLQTAERSLALLRTRLYREYPDFQRLSGAKPLTYTQLKQSLMFGGAADTLFLEYAVVDDATLLFALSRTTGLNGFVLPIGKDALEKRVGDWRAQIDAQSPQEKTQARFLYETLVRPLERKGLLSGKSPPPLVVAGDGPLLDIPFAALSDSQGRRLIRKHALTSVFSLSMLVWPGNARKPSGTLLAIANPPIEGGALPRAEEQARLLLAQFPGAKPLFGRDASKSAVLDSIERYAVLHFGTHGVANGLNGLRSFLALAPDGKKDSILEAAEVASIPLSAQLAVLSACETAQGQKSGGEGLLGLAWAFRAAGCPSIVASQWKVDEAATAHLMRRFYTGLKAGKRKDLALRSAMLDVQQDPVHAAPVFWAAFEVIGNNAALALPK